MAVTTETFAQKLLAEAPPTKDGSMAPQTRPYLEALAPRIWEALWDVLQPFSGVLPLSADFGQYHYM